MHWGWAAGSNGSFKAKWVVQLQLAPLTEGLAMEKGLQNKSMIDALKMKVRVKVEFMLERKSKEKELSRKILNARIKLFLASMPRISQERMIQSRRWNSLCIRRKYYELALGPDLTQLLLWEQFKTKFNEEYCSEVEVRKLEYEFLHLEQGSFLMQEYTSSFLEKERFAEHQISTEKRKIEKYVWGLKTQIREIVQPLHVSSFRQVVDRATER
ncbi:hypothetical protein L2E82_04735 [Cichorium intybus]|uniref:Uncharacterized protein n=1 Tax=Cichorium intybus TaxID=13427 RepID=A0ACB9H5Z1_CICIN|nr:hypothetical protein L2E82_04735 [Cichorium intybus]